MQFLTILSLASIVVADQVLTQIGDGQIQAPTTENQPEVPTTSTETTTAPTTTAPPATETSTTSIPVSPPANTTHSEFENAAPKAVIGGGLAAIAGLAALL
ncbi:hypothetical protein DAPK24_008190 [Pichia kluyveri]|uniref:Uncharacterized protein n=1 Tax=Pichia kluyveri TaxID=36015 RepID=A0AAV5QYG3_PICKL|nr:hypothetical protein DAPK24_008190 [Pichia kluyveri]